MKIQTKIMAVLFLFMALACSKDDNSPVVVTPVKSDAKAITSFSFAADNNAALNSNVSTTVTEASKTVSSSVPNGTDVTALTPTIQISAKASISPIGAQDFSSPVTYTVTAEDGSTAAYRASIMVMASDAKQIVSFVFNSDANDALNEDVGGEIDETEKTIAVTVPSGTDITTLSPSLEIPKNASVDPTGAQDFSEPVTYTVTAEDGSTIEYEVSVEISLSQKDALIAIFNANPNNHLSWIFADEIDTWSGVRLNEEGMVSELFLRGVGLEVLPPEIGVLKAVKELDLQGNNLKTLPPEIGQLTNLTKLESQGSPIETLPEEIGQLSSLLELNLRDHRLTSLPSSIGLLTNLETLELEADSSFSEEAQFGLTSLPTEIGQLTKLTYLNLDKNRLSGLPAEIGNLDGLSFLAARRNELISIPQEIGQLANLNSLYLKGNQLIEIPIEIGQLVNLRYLNVSDNQLTELRTQIGNLTNLRSLVVSNNPIQFIPFSFGSGFRNSLETLHLVGLQLNRIPSWVYKLSNLKSLSLDENSIRTISPDIRFLRNLRGFKIGENQLTSLPTELWELTDLTSLYVDHNQLTEISPEIGQLTKMFFLQINDNNLTSIPREIGQMSLLGYFWLENNQITVIPIEVCNLTEREGFFQFKKDETAFCEN